MRSVLNLVLRFGQVVVPVALVPARRDGDVPLRSIHLPCGNTVGEQTVCPLCGPVDNPDELGKGWEVAPGQHVVVGRAELDQAVPEADRNLEVLGYVDAAAIPPVYVARSYYLRPAKDLAGKRAYQLLAQTLATEGIAILGRYVSHRREKLCAVRTIDPDGLLGLQTLALAEDVIDPSPIHELLADVEVTGRELELAGQLIDRLAGRFDPGMLVGRQRERVRELLEGKLAADEITAAATRPVEGAQPVTPPANLEAALRASLKQTRKPRRRRAAAARA